MCLVWTATMTSSPLGNRVTPRGRGSSPNRYYIYLGIYYSDWCKLYFLVFSLPDRSWPRPFFGFICTPLYIGTCLISNYIFSTHCTFFPSIIIILPSLLYVCGRHVVVVVFCLRSTLERQTKSQIFLRSYKLYNIFYGHRVIRKTLYCVYI